MMLLFHIAAIYSIVRPPGPEMAAFSPTFFPSELRFRNADEAIAHARDWAVRWIDASNITV
jgi:hypothetical protein